MTTTGPIKNPELLLPLTRQAIGEKKLESLTGTELTGPGAAKLWPELLRFENALRKTASRKPPRASTTGASKINPTLEILKFDPSNFPLLKGTDNGFMLVWREPGKTGALRSEPASNGTLLALKMAAEGIPSKEIARDCGVTLCSINDAMREAVLKGLLLKPVSKLRRDLPRFCTVPETLEEFLSSEIFTLQWHVTHACDLHCKHCYDRTKRTALTSAEGLRLLNDLENFCDKKHVWGHVCFSGGNPFMSSHFLKWYKAAADRGFSTSILGNPVAREKLEKLTAVQMPRYFQVSLEGLKTHNDFIRGRGFFTRVMDFLALLKEKRVPSAVMLTLTKDNLADVLPLAEKLRSVADYFTFNRLSGVGKGAKLAGVPLTKYTAFLKDYIKASEDNPGMGFKDNLINLALAKSDGRLFGGCTGFGCGAAFNFVAVLPDGEVHACRKFPSLLGHLSRNSLLEIYDSAAAGRYREGTSACKSCSLKPRCGGCLAVTHAADLDIFTERDPYCFMNARPQRTPTNRPKNAPALTWSDCH